MEWNVDNSDGFMGQSIEDEVIDEMMDEADLMGYSIDDPAFMGGFLKRIAQKIAKRVRARRAKRKGGGGPSKAERNMQSAINALNTPDTRAMTVSPTGAMVPSGGGAGAMMKNPMVLGGLAVAALLAMKMMKKK